MTDVAFRQQGKERALDHVTWRLAAILAASVSTSALMGASPYEESVLDLVWPRKPSIVRPVEGGSNRKLFAVPADIIASTSLLVVTSAAWPAAGTRNAVLAAVGL